MMKSNERTALARTPVIKKKLYSPCNQQVEQLNKIISDVRNECDPVPSTT